MTTQTVTGAVARRDSGPIALMWAKRAHFNAVLPRSVDVEAFLGTAAGALYASDVPGKNVTLMKCAQANPDSLIVALMECAALGHMPGTDEYYLTPRMDHGRPKVLGIEGYKGVIERFYRSGAVANVIVREVCAADPFEYVEGRDDIPRHEVGGRGSTGADFFGAQGSRDRGQMVGVYAYAKLLTGAYSRVVLLNRDDVLAARDSGGYKPDDSYSPWNRLDGGQAHPEFRGRSMWWKTGAKRLEPWVPTSAEYRREQLRASSAAAVAGPRPVAELPAPPGDGVVDAIVVDEPQEQPQPPAAQLEQPQQRRQKGQQRRPARQADEVIPWPGDAPAPKRQPQDAGPPPDFADPREACTWHLDRLKIVAYGTQMDYLTRLVGEPVASPDSIPAERAAELAAVLAAIGTPDELEAEAVRREQDAEGEASGE